MDFEIKLIEFLQAGRSPFFDVAFQVISSIGSVIGVVAVCLLFLVKNRRLFCLYLGTYGVVYFIVSIMKHTIERARPFNVSDSIENIGDVVNSFSFPSGHAACATAIAIFVGYFLFQYFKKTSTRFGIVLSCALYVGLVGLSRMYLGKHYLTDILAGIAISVAICVLGLVLMKIFQKKTKGKINENKN